MKYSFIAFTFFVAVACSPSAPKTFEKLEAKYETGAPHKIKVYEIKGNDTIPTLFKELYPDGQIKVSGSLNPKDFREGKWEAFYEDGKPWSLGFYKNGAAEGKRTVWYATGKKRFEGNYTNGTPSGEWVFWDQSGNEVERKKY